MVFVKDPWKFEDPERHITRRRALDRDLVFRLDTLNFNYLFPLFTKRSCAATQSKYVHVSRAYSPPAIL